MEISRIYKYRNIWMGFAICWVVFYHLTLPLEENAVGIAISLVKQIGYGGVDIFFMASGVGCFFSYEKSRNAYDFLKRRCKRILPTYLLILIIWQIYVWGKGEFDFLGCMGMLFGVSNLTVTGGGISWYITAMWISYLLTPIFVDMVKNANGIKKDIVNILFIVLLTIPFWNTPLAIISITRLPVFYIGMLMAREGSAYKTISAKAIICSIVLSIVGIIMLFFFKSQYEDLILWNYGLYWYPFILITPGLCIGISLFAGWLEKYKFGRCVNKVTEIIGNNTFEIFLVHIVLSDIFGRLRKQDIITDLWIGNTVLVIITIVISYLLCLLRKGMLKIIDNPSGMCAFWQKS